MLPKLDVPIYEVTLPLAGKQIQFRPFLVKEEKILLMAMESKDEEASILAIKQIINNCVLSDIDVEDLPITDLEFLFLTLRARSIGEVLDLQYKCNNKIKNESGEEAECGNLVKLEINLLDIKPDIPENHTKKIELTKTMGMVMRYPSFKTMTKTDTPDEVEKLMGVLVDCIEDIYDAENIYYSKDVPRKEMVEFVEGLTREQFSNVQSFFESFPKLKKQVNFKCPKCGYNEDIFLEGLQSFFG
jgi:hypothetical protein